jgi:phosphoribosylformimino-5-aminoimidazole carboxamide ribotide isomerase
MKVIPAIDLSDGRCVRLYQGDFEKVTEYSDNPVEVARAFTKFSTTDLHVVDLDGARTGRQANRDIIARIAQVTDLEIQLGGGIRDGAALESWLQSGVARCVIGSLAITEPDAVKSWMSKYGAEKIVLALDVEFRDGHPLVTTHGWTTSSSTTVYECIDNFLGHGLRHVLCTDVSRDGAMSGPNCGLYQQILSRFPDLQLQASGGVRNIADLVALRAIGVPAAITGRALLDGEITAEELVLFRQSA